MDISRSMTRGEKINRLWCDWLSRNRSLTDPTTIKPIPEHQRFLQNRLWKAYTAGLEDGKKLDEEGGCPNET